MPTTSKCIIPPFLLYPSDVFSIVLILSLCVFPSCALCLNLASGVPATFLLRFFQQCHFNSGLVCSSKQKWHSLPLVQFAHSVPEQQPPSFSCITVQRVCIEVVLYLYMWEDKNTQQTRFYYPCPVFIPPHPVYCFVCFPPPLVLLPCVVGVQLSAKINGGLVLLAFEADSLLYSVIALFHTCLLLAFCVCVCLQVCVYYGCCTHLAPVHVSEKGWTWKRRLRLADWTIMSSFGCNCLTNVGEKGEKWTAMEEKGVFEMQNRPKSNPVLWSGCLPHIHDSSILLFHVI